MTSRSIAHRAKLVSASDARRLLLSAQGLLEFPRSRTTRAAILKLIEQMGFVQVDSINTVERAHHLILFSRRPGYQKSMLSDLLEDTRDLFEHWTHDASAIPTTWFPHWRHRFERDRHKARNHLWWKQRMGPDPERTIAQVKQRIERDGPLLSRDFEHDSAQHQRPEDGWWGWKPQKAALEHLWRTGELAVARRINFQKVYDLTQRVIPQQHQIAAPSLDEHVDWACRSALERLGFATPREIAAFWNAVDLVQARQWCANAQARGDIVAVNVETVDDAKARPSFALADFCERLAALPQASELDHGIRLLAPFDPVLRDRNRTKRLFDFDFTLEAFTPAAKRRFGYYVLPILEGDALIGRLDPKFHREHGVLEIRGLWLEPRIKPAKTRLRRIETAIENLAAFVGAESVIIPKPRRSSD